MEVKNQMVDQMLVNTVAQTPAGQNTKAAKDADQPDFDSMVHQKRSADEQAGAKSAKPEGKETNAVKSDEKTEPVTDEQYAIAAAIMFQAQPDARYAAIRTETVEAAPELAIETAQPAEAAVVEAEVTLPEAVADTAEAAVEAQAETVEQPQEEPIAAHSETPIEAKREAPVEAKAGQRAERNEPQPERTPRMTEPEAPREERVDRTPRIVRNTERPEAEDDTDVALSAQEAPLFERVEAPVVKVAEAPRPIPLEAEDGVEQLGNDLGDIVVNSVDANRIEVTLTPGELGRLTVEITRGTDGTLNVVLHATTEKAANLLEKGMDGLRQALAQNTEREVQVQVRGSEESQQQFLNPDGQNERQRQQQQQRNGRREDPQNAQDFLQQLRLGLVDVDE